MANLSELSDVRERDILETIELGAYTGTRGTRGYTAARGTMGIHRGQEDQEIHKGTRGKHRSLGDQGHRQKGGILTRGQEN